MCGCCSGKLPHVSPFFPISYAVYHPSATLHDQQVSNPGVQEFRLGESRGRTGARRSKASSIPSRCGATRYATLLCWVLAIGKVRATAGEFTDVFSSSYTTECSGSSTAWAEVCGAGLTSVAFTAPDGFTSAVVLADLSRVGHSVVDETTDLRFKIRQNAEPHVISYVGFSSVRCPESTTCAAPMLHGVVSNLAAGAHVATLEYKSASGTVYFRGNGTTALTRTPDNGGTAIARRISVQIAGENEVVKAAWNSTGSGNSVSWAELPGGSQLNLSRDASTPGSVLVLANLPAVRTGTADVNVEFRIVVNGFPVGFANSGGCDSGQSCSAISMHGLATEQTPAYRHWDSTPSTYYPLGDFNASVQYRVQSAQTVFFGQPRQGEGWTTPPRQLTAFLPSEEEKSTVSWVADNMTCSSTTWASLPTAMTLSFELLSSGTSPALVLASLSRVQAASAKP